MTYCLYAKTCHKQDDWELVGRYDKLQHAVEEYVMFADEVELPDYFYLYISTTDKLTGGNDILMFYARDGYYGI